MIQSVAVIGLAALWVWWVIARTSPPFLMWALRPLRRRPAVYSFLACPWCAGAWIALALTLGAHAVTGAWGWASTPLTWLAASAIVGVAGTLIPDDGEPLDN
ncbi:MAG TPA: DUF1360 domain-containing protein [Brevibacterium sp.]|nr:DUF1360 domain-containing protein [Brevibacterium sp.]